MDSLKNGLAVKTLALGIVINCGPRFYGKDVSVVECFETVGGVI